MKQIIRLLTIQHSISNALNRSRHSHSPTAFDNNNSHSNNNNNNNNNSKKLSLDTAIVSSNPGLRPQNSSLVLLQSIDSRLGEVLP
ncbi:hypothetical protein Ahia01_001165300 [Argonauta hians]